MSKIHLKTYKNTGLIPKKYSDIIRLYQKGKRDGIDKKKLRLFIPIIDKIKHIETLEYNKTKNNDLLISDNDLDMKCLVEEDNKNIDNRIKKYEKELDVLIKELKDFQEHTNSKSVILEIRAGTGGDEAGIFAYELLNMYLKFAIKMKWKSTILNHSTSFKKCIKGAIVRIEGKNTYEHLKYENGVHRVQRIPVTESQGRIHTSACSIVLLPEESLEKITINTSDLRIDVYRSSGPGGQSVNTTDSAVRILHIPTGIVTQCQNEKSQLRNKITAMKILKIKLQKFYKDQQDKDRSQKRKDVIKSGDRSEKIRTYNFPQNRCTDHRLGITFHNLNRILLGNLDILIKK